MFTGIIEDLGKVESAVRFKDRVVLTVSTKLIKDIRIGDSISVNGACLTVSGAKGTTFKADVVSETLLRSSLKHLKCGESVNLERAMPANGRFNGHIVQGHVDCESVIMNIVKSASIMDMEILIPDKFRKYLSRKGSIAVDGVSLTVASMDERYFKVVVIPHTLSNTNLPLKKIGDPVNLEFDVLSKYVEQMIGKKDFRDLALMREMRVDEEFLKKAGFLN